MKPFEKHKLVMIGGGEAFKSDEDALRWLIRYQDDPMLKPVSWKKWLSDGLSHDFDVIRPDMPNTRNAKYIEWKIWFEKHFRYFLHGLVTERQTALERADEKREYGDKKLILVGHSLGASFLVKYLTENNLPRHIHSLHLIAPAYDDTGHVGESLGTFQFSPHALPHFHKQIEHIHIWSSTDDPVVPYDHSVKFHVNLIGSTLHTFHDRGHFVGYPHFVELFQHILKSVH